MNGRENFKRLVELARREEIPAYAGDLCAAVQGRLHRPVYESGEFTITGLCFAAVSSAAAAVVIVWLYAGGYVEQTGVEAIFLGYDPLYTMTALGGV